MNEHIVKFISGHDCIRFECANDRKECKPNTGGSHGRHGMTIQFVSKGPDGAVSFTLFTGWLPQYAKKDSIGYIGIRDWAGYAQPIPAGLDYHSKVARYEGQGRATDSCEYCDGAPCYSDGSGLNSNDAMYSLVNGGDAALWAFMDEYYESVFNGAPYPKPSEYHKKLRQK